MLVELVQALRVSTDPRLGLTTIKTPRAPKTARLHKRLQQIEGLPPAGQRTILKLVDALVDARRRTAPAKRARKASSRRADGSDDGRSQPKVVAPSEIRGSS
jgi:hypothetical protein